MKKEQDNKRVFSSFTLIVTFVCLSLVGLALVPMLSVKLSPSAAMPGLTVSYNMPGNSARIIEAEVTSRLEAILSRVGGIKNIYSTSDNGSGEIRIELDKHADVDMTRFEVSTLVRQIWPQLPDGVSYPLISASRSDEKAAMPFMTYTLNAPSSPILIQQYGEDVIKPLLSQIKGIYKIELNGATPMEWRLEYDNELLVRMGLSVYDIEQALREYYDREFLGICRVDAGGEWIRVMRASSDDGVSFNPSDIKISDKKGNLISLDKLVKVVHKEEEPTGYFRINGLNSIYLSITAEETANQLELADRIYEAMEVIEANLPEGYEIHTGYDATEYIREELDTIYLRTAITLFILLLFVAVITFNMRYLFLIVTSLTVNIAVAFIFYYTAGLEIQLYSLAGITISLNLIIDNIIVMTDHILHRKNLKAFLSILAATLTTIGALSVIFFLDERIRLNLQDFASVVIINLAVSLFVALFFVPPMIDKLGMEKGGAGVANVRIRRFIVVFTRLYSRFISVVNRHKAIAFTALVLAFGIPVFMLPEKIEKPENKGKWAEVYNKVFDNPTYREKVKPIVDKALGGTLRLFVEKVYDGSYFSRGNDETILYVNATLPNGSTLEQMNELIKKMEVYLSEFSEIRQFQTSIYNARRASLQIFFKKEAERSGFPYTLKSKIISKALTLGGGSWSVYGLMDQGFSNDVRENAGNYNVKMYGYNYDELMHWAEEMKKQFLSHRRIKEVTINSEFSWWKDDYTEFFLQFDKQRMAEENLTPSRLFDAIYPIFMSNRLVCTVVYDNSLEYLRLSSVQSREFDVWSMLNVPFEIDGKIYKLSELTEVGKGQAPKKIAKENQQYILCLQYSYIGSSKQGDRILDKDLEIMEERLPLGYTVEKDDGMFWSWNDEDSSQYALLLLVISIIFFISAILFNSLSQPLAIIFVIPISYIGVFLTFYLYGLNFDQGGFASFILLCGITVNASIYILNEYNSIRRLNHKISPLKAYTKAWNHKVIPIFLTVVSTILGFIPFMIGETKEAFWFPLAAGTIGGLVMSVIGIFVYLPVFVLNRKIKK